MDDDFNTPEALAVLQMLARDINLARDAGKSARAAALGARLRELGGVLGLLGTPAEHWLRLGKPARGPAAAEGTVSVPPAGAMSDADIEQRIAARVAARKAKNFAESDRIRAELVSAGVVLEDRPNGTTDWRRA